MKNYFFIGLFYLICNLSHAASQDAWINADKFYSKHNTRALNNLYQINTIDPVVAYFNAKLSLSSNNTLYAENYIDKFPDSYMRNDLIHALLIYYFNTHSWNKYLTIFSKLDENQASVNEKCGYDLANLKLNINQLALSNNSWLINNKMPNWCALWMVSNSKNNKILQPILLNLISNQQYDAYNELAKNFNFPSLNFNFVTKIANSQLNNKYLIVTKITTMAIKNPQQALVEFNQQKPNLDDLTQNYLTNYLITRLAIKQQFIIATELLFNANSNYLSDEQLEWRARIYLYNKNWDKLIDTINLMPINLQNKDVWIYWIAYALDKKGQHLAALDLYKQIPNNYSYYSLLAMDEIATPIKLSYAPTSTIKLRCYAYLAIQLHLASQKVSSSNLALLANQEWANSASNSNEKQLIAMSQAAQIINWNDMSIYAANKLNIKYIDLSFPLLFLAAYKQYSLQNGIEASFALAITRQESRFNKYALASDGGVGLMQIMPATAKCIANKLHSSNCYKNYLCNIRFGTWYLAQLSNKFDNNLIYASAAYNGGPNRAHRWQQSFQGLDSRIQIELIPFKITREYVQKILTNKAAYNAQINNLSALKIGDNLKRYQNANNYKADDDNTDAGKS